MLADDCRVNGTRGRLGDVLSTFLHDLLPDDAHERCRDKTFVRPPLNTQAMLQTALPGKGWTALLSLFDLVQRCQHFVSSRELHGWRTVLPDVLLGS